MAKRNKDREQWKWIKLLAGTALLIVVLIVFSRSESLSEGYMRTVYPVLATVFSSVSVLVSFSLYDIFVIFGVLFYLSMIVYAIAREKRFLDFLYIFLRFTVVLVAWFYFAWGIAYFRKDFYARCDIPEIEYEPADFKDFALRFIDDANLAYVKINSLDEHDLRLKIEALYKEKHDLLAIPYSNGKRRPKPMLIEPLYSKMGVSGYFGPFFNEIHVNDYVMYFDYPFTLAHEMAHQFGVALESEANLYAFIVCASSDDPQIKYSAYNSVLGYVLNDVALFLPDDFEELKARIRPEIIADLKANREHWLAARNQSLSAAQNKIYDAYLKTNKIASGHENYSEVVGLIVSSYGRF
ncbi:MAG: DUF3810 domain-containing protein [Dysgonamonadaceae bacterium]|nr:DUF3810 domain-containing protein [Dysgonamonadaceae bacterium]